MSTIFMPGCSLNAIEPKNVEITFEYLKTIYPDIKMYNTCCKKDDNPEVDTLIFLCYTCHKTMKAKNSAMNYLSIWDIYNKNGLPDYINKNNDKTIAFHDNCKMRFHKDSHETIRNVISQLGYNIEESTNNKNNSKCCGKPLRLKDKDKGIALTNKRANEFDSNTLVSACNGCRKSFELTDKKSIHLFTLMHNKNSTE